MKRIFILLLFMTSLASAQKIILLDKNTNEPISNVSVHTKSNTKHSISNLDGEIDITAFANHEIIYFKHLSYTKYSSSKNNIPTTVFLTPKKNDLELVFLSASKKAVKRSRIAQEIATYSLKEIQQSTPQTAADMLAEIPGIKVQKSQFGGGSPVLRGMEANRVLLVVDGVRMNNAIYRKGHLQNSISISPNMLERTEIVFGPSSVIYGSDALGGVIHYITKQPKPNDKFKIKPSFLTRYSTVNDEFSYNIAAEVQAKKMASFTSLSYSKFGDLKMGKNRKHGFTTWGLQNDYSNNTADFYTTNAVENNNPETQKNSGFKQVDFLQKIYIPLAKQSDIMFNLQYSKSSDIPRFDRLMQRSNGDLKFAEWYYGPQERILGSSQLKINPNYNWLKNGIITIAYQNLKESRVQRKFTSLNRSIRKEEVSVYSINADFEAPISKTNKRIFSYGTEFTYNDVSSTSKGKKLQVIGNEIVGFDTDFVVQTRYPDGGSSYISSAWYLNYRQDISPKETLNSGIRYTNTTLRAKWQDQTFITLPNSDIKLNNAAVTATIGYVFKPIKSWQFNSVISSGFRSPNIDDIGKIREKNGYVTVPNVHLKPEHVYNAEIGILKYFNYKKTNISFTTYYTLLNKYITRELFTLNGVTTINYDNEIVQTIANVNKGTAYIYGATLSFNGKITTYFNGKASFTYTKGRAYDTEDPLSSIPPLFGMLEFGYSNKKWETNLSFKFSAKKKLVDYNILEGIDNIEQTPINEITGLYDLGNPAWQTLNYNASYNFTKKIKFILNIDNIFDQHYKEFASSISAPGRNFSFTFLKSF